MEQNNNNNPNPNQNFNSPERVGVSREYVNRRVFGERLHENNNSDEAEAPINNNLVQNNRFLGILPRRLVFNNPNSTVAGSDYINPSIANISNHFLSEVSSSSNSSDIEGLSFSDYEERFPEPGNSSIEPKIVKKVKSDSRSK
jgi:hypothetical protein